MILKFNSGSDFLFIGVSDERLLSIASVSTKLIFVPVSKLKQFKAFSIAEKVALDETVEIVKGLKNDIEVKSYVVSELEKLGFVFDRELSLKEYLRIWKSGFRK